MGVKEEMNRLVACIAALMMCGVCSVGLAQEPTTANRSRERAPALTGQVAYENPNLSARNHQLDALEQLDKWSAGLGSIVGGAGEGISPELNQNAISYLSVLYLYCSVKQGPCPFILETILDDDITRSRSEKTARCPLTNRFFKRYISQSLDERAKFLFSLSDGLEVAKFNSEERPRFVACKETVSSIIADQDVLRQRYGDKGASVETLETFRALLADLRENKVDIYGATGIKGPS